MAPYCALLIGALGVCRGGELAVCVVDEVGLSGDTVTVFRASLAKRGKAIGVVVRFEGAGREWCG